MEKTILDYKVEMEGLEQLVFLTDILLSGRYNFTRLVTIDRKKATFELSYLSENQKNLIDTLVALLKIDKDVLKGLAHYEYVSDAVVDVADMVVAEGMVR